MHITFEGMCKKKMSHKHVVAVVVSCEGNVLVGKHADGPFRGKWGLASIDASVDNRPQRVALRLAESSLLGLLGNRNNIKLKKRNPSALGLQIYELETHVSELPTLLANACSFLTSCFPAGATPTGLVAWTSCAWVKDVGDLSMDPFSQDAILAWKTTASL